jgi:polyphosphate kinase
VIDARLRQRLITDLDLYLADNTQAWELQASGDYLPLSASGDGAVSAQTTLLAKLAEAR